MDQRILVVGAGAIGGFFGAQLASAGRDVTFLVRPARAETIKRHGITIHSESAPARVADPQLVTADNLPAAGAFDLIVLTCKAFDLTAAMDDISASLARGGVVLPLLNGIGHLDQLDTRFGAEAVLGGTCFVSVHLGANQVITHNGGPARLTFGERSPTRISSTTVKQLLHAATFELRYSSDVLADMWAKWVFLASAAATTGLFGATVGEIVEAGGTWVAPRVIAEAASIASTNGYPQSTDALAAIEHTLTEPGSTLAPSLLQDLIANKPTESDHIIGDLIARRPSGDRGILDVAALKLRIHNIKAAAS